MIPKDKKTLAPLVAGALGVALLSFIAGRAFAPDNPANIGTNQTPGSAAQTGTAADEHGEDEAHGEGEHGEGDEHGDEAIVFEGNSARDAGIEVQAVFAAPLVAGLPVSGSIEPSPNRLVRVASVVPGRITRLNANIGQRVTKGQLLAIVESRSVGEAQAAFETATARLQNARSNLSVVEAQARAGVFSRTPLETARRALAEANAETRTQEIAVSQAQTALDNANRLARAGSFAAPALEAARAQQAEAQESLRTANAALTGAQSSVRAAQSELARRRQLASAGAYSSRPVEEARRLLVAAQSARSAAQSEVATTRANLSRARTLNAEGLVSGRDLEAAGQAFETAEARLATAQADERAAQTELERQRRLASSGVANTAEVGEAERALVAAQADVRTRGAQLARARESVRLADVALKREQTIYGGGVANRREISAARGALGNARVARDKARQTRAVAGSAFAREERIYRQNLNNNAQIGAARSQFVAAQSELNAARTALQLLKSSPGGSASVPIRAPLGGIVIEREVAPGEVLDADARLMTIADPSIVHADFFVPEAEIAKVRVGAPVQLRANAVPNRVYTGEIELIHTQLDPATRTVETHAEVANPGGLLRFGMAISGTIQTGTRNRLTLRVPTEAVQDMEGETIVFVAGEQPNKFQTRPVEIGETSGGQTVIKNGLKSGDRIVVKGAFMVKAQSMKSELGHDHD